MKKQIQLAAILLAFTTISATRSAAEEAPAEIPSEAAGIGEWTTDWPAAVKVAQERKLPIFLQFTGSDWCGWCIKMENECFSKPEFLDAMKSRCVLVVADFPHKTELPAELKAQNTDLASKYKKRGGFPSYYMLDADAQTVQWSFGAHPKYGKDMDLLISDIDDFVAGTACVVERVTKDLPEDTATAYRKAAASYSEKRQAVTAWLAEEHPDPKATKEKFTADVEELKKLKAAMDAALPSVTTTD